MLNLVVGLGDKHRAEQCDKLVAKLAASHPLRAILVHLHGGRGAGTLDGVFLVGIGAVLLQLLLFPALRHRGAVAA